MFVPPVSFFGVLFLFVLVFLGVLFSLFSFVLRSLAILPASIVIDIVEGQRRGRGTKNGQNSLWGKNIEKTRGAQKWPNCNMV